MSLILLINKKGSAAGTTYDSDAQAFFYATGINDTTQMSAVDTLVTSLKSNSLWTKFYAIYPMVGGTATTHKYNLKDPRDLDAAYRLVFSGGWTHSATGAKPNGSTGWADTKLVPSSVLTYTNCGMSHYSRTNVSGLYADMGAANATTTQLINIYHRKVSGQLTSDLGYWSLSQINVAVADSLGFVSSSRTSTTSHKVYKGGSNIATDTDSDSAGFSTTTRSIVLAASNDGYAGGGPIHYSPREIALAGIHQSLSDADASALNTIVQTYQTTLSRQV